VTQPRGFEFPANRSGCKPEVRAGILFANSTLVAGFIYRPVGLPRVFQADAVGRSKEAMLTRPVSLGHLAPPPLA